MHFVTTDFRVLHRLVPYDIVYPCIVDTWPCPYICNIDRTQDHYSTAIHDMNYRYASEMRIIRLSHSLRYSSGAGRKQPEIWHGFLYLDLVIAGIVMKILKLA